MVMVKNYFEDFEYLLPLDSFYHNSDVIREYGPSYEFFIMHSLLIRDEELFRRYQSEDLITITTQRGTSSVSKTLLLDLLTNEGLYKYIITNLDNELSVGARLDLFADGEIKDSIQIGRADLSLFFLKLNPSELSSQQRMRIALITKFTSVFSLQKKYSNYDHVANIDGELISYKATDLIDILLMPEEEFKAFIYSKDLSDERRSQMIYMLVNFVNINRILEKYILPKSAFQRYEALESQSLIDFEVLNKNLKANDNDLDGTSIVDKVVIDPEFLEEILKYKKDTYSNIEMSIYVYVRLCELLTYNQEHYAGNEQDEQHRLTAVREINIDNNAVTNYEFLLLYAHILKKLGIRYTLDNRLLSGNASSCSLTFREGEFLVEANVLENILDNDMTNAKINSPLLGLRCTNKNAVSREKFEELLFKIVMELIDEKENRKTFAESLSLYHDKYARTDLSLKDKLYVLFKDTARPNLKGIDAISYQKKVFDNLFRGEENIHINFISSSINPYRSYTFTPLTIISYFSDGEYHYFIIDPNNSAIISSITKEELAELFESKDYAYIDKNDPVIKGLAHEESRATYVR